MLIAYLVIYLTEDQCFQFSDLKSQIVSKKCTEDSRNKYNL